MTRAPSSRRLAAYWHIFWTAAREDRANPSRTVFGVTVACFRVLLIIAIYKIAYSLTKSSAIPYVNAMWSIGLYFCLVVALGTRDVYHLIDQDVKSGAVETALIKPLGWRLRNVFRLLGQNMSETFWTIVALVTVLTIFTGLPEAAFMTPAFLAGYIVLFILSTISTLALFVMVGMTSFWLNDAKPVFRIFHKVILIFGGAYVPFALLPELAQTVLRYSPFGVYTTPGQLFSPGLGTHFWPTLVSSLFWTVLTVIACNLVWKRVSNRIEINGG